jgi:hypothetical protein
MDKETKILFEKVEQRQEEFRKTIDSILEIQGKQLNEMHYLLKGTTYEQPQNGGLVGDVEKLKTKVKKNTNWRMTITTAGTTIATAIGFVLFKLGTVLSNLKELIK